MMACLLLFKQFLLLLWKNFILQLRRPIGTTFEVVLPTLAVVVLIGLRFGISAFQTNASNCFVTYEPDNLKVPNVTSTEGLPYTIYFTPNNPATNKIMSRVVERLGVQTRTLGFDSQTDMVNNLTAIEYPRNQTQTRTCFNQGAGIVFDNLNGTNIEYTLRLREPEFSDWTTNSRGTNTGLGSRDSNDYLEEGFLHLQNAVGQSIIEVKANKTINLTVSVEQFPYPPYQVNNILVVMAFFLHLLVVMAFIFSAGIFVKELVLEKESRIRETMLMMGLNQWVLWSTWYLKQFIFFMISVIMICILLKFGQIFPQSDFLLLLIFFTIFVLSMISFCFFISVWFNSARIGLIVGFVAWFANYFPYFFALGFSNWLPFGARIGFCVLSNTCMGLGVEIISQLEQRQGGLQWDNVAIRLFADDNFSMAWVLGMLLIDSTVYMLFAWYINGVKPGKYGVPKPFYFPCLPSYWIGKSKRSKAMEPEPTVAVDNTNHEVVTDNLEVGISIKNLTKIYGRSLFARVFSKVTNSSQKKAVDNISLDMYKGQITALLGHNGAGKTTTMSILTGLYTPTSGTAIINGFSIITDMDQIRTSLGICPQHNIIFDRLTVSEHLSFFLQLKGVFNRKRVRDEVKAMVADLQLIDKANIQANKLSGGMKRKLSVAIALIGGSEVVILDEPTSGMDPYARRATWDLLTKHKSGRTMLLTTHFMDEADLLGDRIAIMAEGKLRCSGSSLFLKSKYGIGYHMTIVKEGSCDPSQVENVVKSLVPQAEQVTDVGAELSYILPSSSTPLFPELFDKLEVEKPMLGIRSFGISVTTMEEVFMKVGEGVDGETVKDRLHQTGVVYSPSHSTTESLKNNTVMSDNLGSETNSTGVQVSALGISNTEFKKERLHYNFTPNTGLYLWLQQFWAMFIKKFYNSLRFYGALVSQLVIPVIFIILSMVLHVVPTGSNQDAPIRVLSLENSAIFPDNLILFYAQFGDNNPLFLFSGLKPSDLGAANIVNFTDGVQHIRNTVNESLTLDDCCNYHYQLLDQYCVSRPYRNLNETCSRQTGFGYASCPECLSCCQPITSRNTLRSCSNSLSLTFPSASNCPAPPKLSYSSIQNPEPRGSLESDNVYIAEYLLQTADMMRPDTFFRHYQAGFSLNYREPLYCLCDCNEAQDICNFMLPLNLSNSGISSVQCGRLSNEPAVGAVCLDMNHQVEATVWYNNQPIHMSAAALNAFHNVLLKNVAENDTLSITVNNHPLPRNIDPEEINDATTDQSVALGFFVVAGYSSLLASFALFLVKEKESKAKHLQFVSGVHSTSYWLATFVWDLLNALVPTVISIIIFAAFQVPAYSSPEALGAIFLLLLLTTWSGIPITYLVSFAFSNPLAAFAVAYLFFFFSSMLLQTVILGVQFSNQDTAKTLDYIFFIFPTYGVGIAFTDLNQFHNMKDRCLQDETTRKVCANSDFVDNPLDIDRPGIGLILVYMFVEGILFFILTVSIQKRLFLPNLKALFKKKEVQVQTHTPLLVGQDSDVHEEANRVLSGNTTDDDVVIIKNLVKVYSAHLSGCRIKPAKRAVNGISLAIPNGECFGLLGVNGAGKTTTFSILTGDFSMTSGTAVIGGYDIRTHLRDVQQRIGYCPQFDALLERLTGQELLTMFARLRGVPEKQIKEVVETEITRLDLKKYADKRCGTYSGGNKRKLSTAIALVGNPPIVLLDEPTTGMDPTTRRYLWDVLTGIIQEGRSIVLTSHSMEECEVLCTRLAIMINGSFKCLGSVQHLKNKFSSGLTLQAKVKLSPPPEGPTVFTTPSKRLSFRQGRSGSQTSTPVSEGETLRSPSTPVNFGTAIQLSGGIGSPARSVFNPYDATSLHIFIREAFPGAVLLEEHQGTVTYQLPGGDISWSSIFRQIENNKERLGIVDYSVSQTSLDQVFINFAKEQQEE